MRSKTVGVQVKNSCIENIRGCFVFVRTPTCVFDAFAKIHVSCTHVRTYLLSIQCLADVRAKEGEEEGDEEEAIVGGSKEGNNQEVRNVYFN